MGVEHTYIVFGRIRHALPYYDRATPPLLYSKKVATYARSYAILSKMHILLEQSHQHCVPGADSLKVLNMFKDGLIWFNSAISAVFSQNLSQFVGYFLVATNFHYTPWF